MDIARGTKMVREVVSNVEEEEEEVVREREAVERRVVTNLTRPCLQQVEDALIKNRLDHVQLF